MDPQVQKLICVVEALVARVGALTDKVDGLLCHYTSIDADYTRMRGTLVNHERRLMHLEASHGVKPDGCACDPSSAVFPAVNETPP
jgi:hypothetical protein